jgi:hypothetical protein
MPQFVVKVRNANTGEIRDVRVEADSMEAARSGWPPEEQPLDDTPVAAAVGYAPTPQKITPVSPFVNVAVLVLLGGGVLGLIYFGFGLLVADPGSWSNVVAVAAMIITAASTASTALVALHLGHRFR